MSGGWRCLEYRFLNAFIAWRERESQRERMMANVALGFVCLEQAVLVVICSAYPLH